MLDQLNLEHLTDEIQRRKRRARYHSIARILIIMLFIAAPVSLLARFNADSIPTGSLYTRHQGDNWQQVEALTGAPTDIQVSPSGKVWVQTVCPYQLSRFDGSSWQTYNDFGGSVSCGDNGFALAGEDVWAITCDGVAHFEGHLWSLYPESVPGSCPEAITASDSGVFTANFEGDLGYFDGETWTVKHAADVLPGYDPNVWSDDPMLRTAPDGSIWLLFHGLWQHKDGEWREILWDGERHVDWPVRLAGVDNRYLWLGQWGGIHLYEYGRNNWWGYDEADLSITEATWVYEVAIRDEEYWVATADGIRVYKDEIWRKDALPDSGASARVVLAPDGGIWASSLISTRITIEEMRQLSVVVLVPMLVIVILLLIAIIILSRDGRRGAAILGQFTADMKKPRVSYYGFLIFVIVLVAIIVGISGGWGRVPDSAVVASFLGLAALPFLVMIIPSRWLLSVTQQLDYEKVLRRATILGRLLPKDSFMLHLRGTAMLYAGRYQESEQLLRKSLIGARGLTPFYQSGFLNNLSYPLMLQGRYEEAMRCLEAAIEIYPASSNAYASLADVYLYQGIEPERALELMEYAIQIQKTSRKGAQSIHWATRAWALALMGHFDEAAESLQTARAGITPANKPWLAELEFISGEFHRLAGRLEEAKVYYNEVLAIDSQGMWRDRAERALRSINMEAVHA